MVSRSVTIRTETGVHARPAAMFVKLANRFPCDIYVEREGVKINGKSIMGLMMLALTRGSTIIITAEGEKEDEAVNALVELVEKNFEKEDILTS
ncbi:MAG: HPr family phosphocarrier protein [Leptospiraceae bacterium]|nr:HPr family phosphocarrier protein [Leptospiraceae bacterium]MDW8305538.1 HPr family phosphocarrier protein [Leptospiraceae bacterium]